MNFRCYFGNAEVAKKLVGAFDTNPSAAPLTGSIAKRLHPDTEKESQGERLRWALARPNSGIQCLDFKRIPKGATMRSLIIMTILCLISTPTFACVFHKDCKPGSTCVDGVCSDELRVTTMTTCLRVTLTTMSHEASDWEDLEDLRRRQRLQPRFPLHQGFRPPGCPPRPLTASRDGTYGGIAGDPALHQKKKPGNGPDFSAV